ncbi:putative diguanylate cyclase/phosphodiesterase with PAS/PAC and GAF sensor(s), partial [Methylorubrum extorquens DSM 13060]
MPLRPQRPIDPDRAFGRGSVSGTALAAVLAAVAGASAALAAA